MYLIEQLLHEITSVRFNLSYTLSVEQKLHLSFESAFTLGSGQHQPSGFLNTQTVEHGKGTSEAIEQWSSGEDDLPDTLLDVMHALPSEYANGALWMMSRTTLARVKRLKNASTGHYLWQPSLTQGTPETLLGHSVVLNDDMDTRLAFGNFSHAYQIVDRSDVNILRDPYSSKPFVEFFATKRVGGSIVQANAIKLLNLTGDAS